MLANGCGDCRHFLVAGFATRYRWLQSTNRPRHHRHRDDQQGQEYEYGAHADQHEYRSLVQEALIHIVFCLQRASGRLY